MGGTIPVIVLFYEVSLLRRVNNCPVSQIGASFPGGNTSQEEQCRYARSNESFKPSLQ